MTDDAGSDEARTGHRDIAHVVRTVLVPAALAIARDVEGITTRQADLAWPADLMLRLYSMPVASPQR